MPKKLGVNTKAVEAKARKDAVKQEQMERTARLKEEELWKDDDKHVVRKQNRKEEKEKKKQELADRKATKKELYDQEMTALKSKAVAEERTHKLSRFEIKESIPTQTQNRQAVNTEVTIDAKPLEENVNRLLTEDNSARSVEDAIALLSTKEPEVDRHPEKRVKAAYNAFESENLPRLKSENPNLRLSQLKQILKKDWMKSPDNPLNQMNAKYNTKT